MVDDLWTCPDCGNRFVTMNTWHSCGLFSLEDLFSSSQPFALELARHYVSLLEALGDVEVIPQKTRLTALARVRFAGLMPRQSGFVATFALRYRLDDPRIAKVEEHAADWWTHHVNVNSMAGLDEQLLEWVQESHDTVGLQEG